MRAWNIHPSEKLTITLAADARLTATNYCDDQIWELTLGGSPLPALAIQSTLGLRARSLRLFPRFRENDLEVMLPDEFARPVSVVQMHPNFLAVRFSPFPGIDVTSEYWVPQSDGLAGSLQIKNVSPQHRLLRVEWVGMLVPTEGQRMALVEIDDARVLCGETEQLFPVLLLSGGSQDGGSSYPALTRTLELPPGHSQKLSWALAAGGSPQDSLQAARRIAARRWAPERARLEMLSASSVQVFTGEPDWDLALALSQNLASNLLVGPAVGLPQPSFVLARQPEHGFSTHGDGNDYPHQWNGQPVLEAAYLAGLLLPGQAAYLQGILENFLAVQEPDGSIDWKPGLAGQRSRILATPLLADLTWRYYEFTQNTAFLKRSYAPLSRFIERWFSSDHDRDEDGYPEWDHPVQMGFDDHPTYARGQDWTLGQEISSVETPAMASMLVREIDALQKMALVLGLTPDARLESRQEALKASVQSQWVAQAGLYRDRDRDGHNSLPLELLARQTGSGSLQLERSFPAPVRLLVHIRTGGETVRQAHAFVHGTSLAGQARVERLGGDQFRWQPGRGVLTGERIYTHIEKIELHDLSPRDEVLIYSTGYTQDTQASLLPLWAGIPDQAQASTMLETAIDNPLAFGRPYGIPACTPALPGQIPSDLSGQDSQCDVHLPWNALIGEGLLAYGYRAQAAALITRLMSAITQSLAGDGAFRRSYHADTGLGAGERNPLVGLAPLGLFMETLGVRLVGGSRVLLSGFNPFPWPVTVKYRGLTILRYKERTTVVFPDGQLVDVDDPSPQMVSLE